MAKRQQQQEPSYAEAIAEIERILGRFRNEEMEVDSLAAEVKRATELIALCKTRLHKAEEEVNKILEA
ncbi:exodeoxyribonuclease VII small subunit [uncultured Alistipes sp.]|uniref:exodeoxyribonuclease VII small subunit n=1 Tax=uncultured Alistipes sp. TaxID=538949 RepID=UPI0028040EA0|nr:exodeoxyribonuclease VII small subunit [uncultured Alistipes sp.]